MGIDYAWEHPSPAAIRSAGYTFVCRYLSRTAAKNLTRSEADSLIAAGLDIVCNWEATSNAALNGYSQGVTDAQQASTQADQCGMPAGRPIYFSVDFDASSSQQPAINSYFDGVASVLGLGRTGGYGGYNVIQRLFGAGKIVWGWQTYAWSSGHWDSRAQLRQVQNGITVGGAECDANQAMAADFGQWGSLTENLGTAYNRWLVRADDGHVQAYARNTNNTMSNVDPCGNGWSPMGGNIGGNPAAVLDSVGHVQLYVRASDNSLQHVDPSGAGWSSMGGNVAGDPCAVLDPAGGVQVYVRGADSSLQHVDPSGAGWSSMGGAITGNPTAVVDSAGHTQIYVRSGNTLWHVDPSGGGWSSMGGDIAGDPCALLDPAGNIQIYVRGRDNSLQHVDVAGKGWASMGGWVAGNPIAVLDPAGHIQIYIRAGNVLWHVDPSGGGWSSMGGTIAGDPVALLDSVGSVQVYARGTDSSLQRELPNASWSSLGGSIAN
ncbi:hypothetical protein GCM10023322_59740 [Rugosimonospora acidiphila]|uniref:DUF1906 domain-containing protein n=1 Tax=Rugosimonospora acidiphila TaxID=556531 RepID=A0ABP9SFY1_9ACTN